MKALFLFYFFLWVTGFSVAMAQQSPSIIPEPVEIKKGNGTFLLDRQTVIIVPSNDQELMRLAQSLATWLAPATGFTLKIENEIRSSSKQIKLSIDPAMADVKTDEGYKLSVNTRNINITAPKAAGIFCGLQTLRQLFPAAIERKELQTGNWVVPCLEITDYPRLAWRGLMLDVSRHFFSKEFVMDYIDQMARYKFNILHWHLTDDQGWRIEIKAFPKLTEVGAWRVPRVGRWWTYEQPRQGELATDGGFYTQADIKEVVEYAAQRHITVLPEIDVPGHSLAAIAAYPYLSATGYIYPVNPGSKFYNIQDNTLNPADERIYDFLNKVFTEVAELFPSEYIHIGGDECSKVFWQKSAVVKNSMNEKGIKSEHEMQSYFIKRLEKILQSKHKKLIGWDEILEGGLAPDATVMSWRGMAGGIQAAMKGHKVIMTPASNTYLDLYQGDPITEPDTYSMLRLKTSYQWNPIPDSVDAALILGGQGNLWTESVPTGRHAEYMTWPRSLALSEVFWSPQKKQIWDNFQSKLEPHFQRLDNAGINYSTAAYDVLASAKRNGVGQLFANLSTDIDGLTIYYTLDNTNPDAFSNKYNGTSVEIPKGIYQLRTIAYRGNVPAGKVLVISRDELEIRAKK